MLWVHGPGVKLRMENEQPHGGLWVSAHCCRALCVLAELCTGLDVAEVGGRGRLWVSS